ncbi:hypothetical protein CA13_71730 [Planctomycetes bacterium CA13]|uniref:Type II secretion system protein GspF domain-containing protein n=1 Tax=Novipirellula herctigrandis TaxID=2527986 RepID=A0A5C5YP23_9BACT|nr:hypothetical protein CA13_71730 [Planctomycetes bacterium CA13]
MQNTLDRILAFNEQLVLLSRAGLPVDLGDGRGADSIESAIEKINAALTLAVARGQSVEEVIQQSDTMSESYRHSVATLLRSDDSTVALDRLTARARIQRELTFDLSHWLFQLGVLLLLVLIGFTYLIFQSAPRIESYFDELGIAPGPLAILTTARNTYGIWFPIVLGMLVLGVVGWKKYANRIPWSALPGGNRYATTRANADTANRLASLTNQNIPLDDAMATTNTNPTTLAPLLRWAIEGDLGGEPRGRVLQSVATIYEQKANNAGSIWRVLVPSVVTTIIGGIIALAFALSVFLPWVYFLNVLT